MIKLNDSLGMKQLVELNCTEPYELKIADLPHNISACDQYIDDPDQYPDCPCNLTDGDHCVGTEWPAFVEPIFVMFLHFFCAFTFKVFKQMEQVRQRQGMLQGIHDTDPIIEADDCLSSDTQHRSNISTNSPVSMAALTHRISIFAARLPPKKQITIALREKLMTDKGSICLWVNSNDGMECYLSFMDYFYFTFVVLLPLDGQKSR
jgi:hypothetical protein